jgi:CTP:molybdopterin cytidylyltransferase MocA
MRLVSGVLLAAGAGTRLGRPKAQITLGGVRLLDRALDVLRAGGCDDLVAVLRTPEQLSGVTTIVNPQPQRGMGSSLRLGLAAGRGEIAVVLLVDTPGIGADAVRAVIDAVRAGAPVALADFGGRRVPPVAFARPHWAEVAELAEGDQGARGFLRAHPELVTAVPCAGDPSDIDTPADLARFERRYDPSGGDHRRGDDQPGRNVDENCGGTGR